MEEAGKKPFGFCRHGKIKEMKVLLVNKFFYLKGGAENSFFTTANLLESKEHKVSFFSMQDVRNLPTEFSHYFVSNVDYESAGIIEKSRAALRMFYSFEARNKIERLIDEVKPDLVHLNSIYHQISPSIIHSIKKYDIPMVMSLRDYKTVCASYLMLANGQICEACKNGSYYHCLMKKCTKESRLMSLLNTAEMYFHHTLLHIYELVHAFVAPSVFLKNKVQEMGFKGKVVYLPNFVDPKNFVPQYSYNENSIIYFGRLSKEKGLSTLIEAMKGVNLKLKIIGDGPSRDSLESKVMDLALNNVEFLGFKGGDDLKNEIKKAMFVVVPSEWYENNPRSVIEAFALGKPVIGARIGGIPELVRDNETGLTFEPGSPADLASKIEVLTGNPEKITEMGKNARKFVEQELNAEKHYEGLIAIYEQAIKNHRTVP